MEKNKLIDGAEYISLEDAKRLKLPYFEQVADRQEEVSDGNIVVAFVNGGLTVKTLDMFTKDQGFLRLMPANPEFKPIIIDANDQFILQSKVTSIHRDTRKY